ncbi:18709_t:CDS:2 [Acaulospora morrowiae]|uniref:18709_t:CDS:1 n=1 Tax=Acaulospora morrowiae TaxID=94023 RepID=A0A9N9N475_9GLOM|nr:18709_t:CDS:2 [Acaulospora morrowiae]
MAIAQEHPASHWVESREGQIPEGAWYVGENAGGRGWYDEGLHVGYVVPGRGLMIGYGGNEVNLRQYEVLRGDPAQYRWIGWWVFVGIRCFRIDHVSVDNIFAQIPTDLVKVLAIHDISFPYMDGRELYIAKGWYNGREVTGKAGPHLEEGMSFGIDGQENSLQDYQVLALLG